MEALEVLDNIEKESSKIEELRSKLLVPKKIQLHTGLEGFNSPDSFGVYKNTGGDCLGVVGRVFEPMDLNQFLDSIVNSITHSNLNLDLDKLDYREYKSGRKVIFSIPLKEFEVPNSPMVGDVISSKLIFKTGYDGMTKASVSYSTYRLWCKNGAGSWQNEVNIAFKNTRGNHDKIMLFSEHILQVENQVGDYIKRLGELALKSITQKQIDDYYLRVFGINRHTYAEAHKRTQATFDKINEAVAIETANTGNNAYSLLQGVTRHISHNMIESEDDLLFSSAATLNRTAHAVAFSLN